MNDITVWFDLVSLLKLFAFPRRHAKMCSVNKLALASFGLISLTRVRAAPYRNERLYWH